MAIEEKLQVQQAKKRPLDDVQAQSDQDLRQQVVKLKQLKMRRLQVEQKTERLRQNHEDYVLIREVYKLNLQMIQELLKKQKQERQEAQQQRALEQIPRGREKSEDIVCEYTWPK